MNLTTHPLNLGDYDLQIARLTAFITPSRQDWRKVDIRLLEDLSIFLDDERNNFYTILSCISQPNGLVYASLRNIFRNLHRFTAWYCGCAAQVIESANSEPEEYQVKAELMQKIALTIDATWHAYIKALCPAIVEDAALRKECLTTEEQKEYFLYTKREAVHDEEVYQLLDCFNDADPIDRNAKNEILADMLKGLGGVNAAFTVQAAIELKWLNRKPSFPLMQKYWGLAGSQQAFSNALSRGRDKGEVESKKNILTERFTKVTL